MKTVQQKATINYTLQLNLTEVEARALHSLTDYGIESFLKVYYAQLGKDRLSRYEPGLRQLFAAVSSQVGGALDDVAATRKLIDDAIRAREVAP